VRVVFDQGTPAPLRRAMPHHSIATAFELGWSTLRNGELLSAAEAAGFDVFVTTDTNLRYQQNLVTRQIAIVVLTSTSWPRIRTVIATVVAAVDQAASVRYAEVVIP
jgi:hypothetical protein